MLDLLSRPVGSLCDVAVMSTHIKFFVMFIPGCLSRALLSALHRSVLHSRQSRGTLVGGLSVTRHPFSLPLTAFYTVLLIGYLGRPHLSPAMCGHRGQTLRLQSCCTLLHVHGRRGSAVHNLSIDFV